MFIDAKWEKVEEEEDFYQKVHAKSLLQRVLNFWRPFWMDSGENWFDINTYLS